MVETPTLTLLSLCKITESALLTLLKCTHYTKGLIVRYDCNMYTRIRIPRTNIKQTVIHQDVSIAHTAIIVHSVSKSTVVNQTNDACCTYYCLIPAAKSDGSPRNAGSTHPVNALSIKSCIKKSHCRCSADRHVRMS